MKECVKIQKILEKEFIIKCTELLIGMNLIIHIVCFKKKDLLLHDINLDEEQQAQEEFFLTDGDYLPNINQKEPGPKVSNTQSRTKLKVLDTVQFPVDNNYNRFCNESIMHKKKRISQLGNPTKKHLTGSKSVQKLD